ncbi:24643_t:CDS:2 [Dentiscutata erythropus]|uniref:24643_t:CDS:1 n=1 Tax=Dentiscutata erythropus TaxID=1348616 RepID=A0A9N9I3W2_9GLOM|nr:24643_t:CDS:2 [Dentiscutata erythropus]
MSLTQLIRARNKSYYSSDEESSDSEESKVFTIKHSICTHYKIDHEFPDPKYKFNLKARGITTPEKWTYRDDQDPSSYNTHWKEYGD